MLIVFPLVFNIWKKSILQIPRRLCISCIPENIYLKLYFIVLNALIDTYISFLSCFSTSLEGSTNGKNSFSKWKVSHSGLSANVISRVPQGAKSSIQLQNTILTKCCYCCCCFSIHKIFNNTQSLLKPAFKVSYWECRNSLNFIFSWDFPKRTILFLKIQTFFSLILSLIYIKLMT